ncbi:glucuronate isomerase [Chloroflexi bacterium TSY]|nr:glucuronate isomerase [Chloroflexi bacterium TSY]
MSQEHEQSRPHDRYFDSNPAQKEIALHLYAQVANLPLICPHGHVDPILFSQPDYQFPSPTRLLITPDHYVFRMLYSQGVPLENLGIPRLDGSAVEEDDRVIWQTFADHYYLFRGTPTGMWLNDELQNVFGVQSRLKSDTAQEIYDQIEEQLRKPEFKPRALFEQFNIEVLCTTDPATSNLEHHRAIRESDWDGRVLPTFRPDAVMDLQASGWQEEIDALSTVSGIEVNGYRTYIEALEKQRVRFRELGATATDHSTLYPYTERVSDSDASAIFDRALKGMSTKEDAQIFMAHMLMEMGRMSCEDGLVMQLHTGIWRSHNQWIHGRFGGDMGCDIPVANEFTRNLHSLLNAYGNHPNFRLILFMLDESTLSRELAPLAGHYPSVQLGPPWWFFDSWNGMMRFRELVSETTGLYNTVGFNDDTRAYPSIPARHDLARRVDANWLANLVTRHVTELEEAEEMVRAAAYELAKDAYCL